MLGVIAARAAAVLMAGVAVFQVALVFGAPWGAYTQGGGVTALAWFTTIYVALAVVLNLITSSTSERAVFAPTSTLIFVLVVTALVCSRRSRAGGSGAQAAQ